MGRGHGGGAGCVRLRQQSKTRCIAALQQLPLLTSTTPHFLSYAGGALGLGERAAALQPGRRNVAPARYANAGNITAWGGGTGFDPADAQRELEAFRRPQLARVASEIAEHDRAAGRYPYASRTE